MAKMRENRFIFIAFQKTGAVLIGLALLCPLLAPHSSALPLTTASVRVIPLESEALSAADLSCAPQARGLVDDVPSFSQLIGIALKGADELHPAVTIHYAVPVDPNSTLGNRPFVDARNLRPNTVVELLGIGPVVYLGRKRGRGNLTIQLLRVNNWVEIEMSERNFVPYQASRLTPQQEEHIQLYLQKPTGSDAPPADKEEALESPPQDMPDKGQPPFKNGDVVMLSEDKLAVFAGPAKKRKGQPDGFWLIPVFSGAVIRKTTSMLTTAAPVDLSQFDSSTLELIEKVRAKALGVAIPEMPNPLLPVIAKEKLIELLELEMRDVSQATRNLAVKVFFKMTKGASIEHFIETFIKRADRVPARWIPPKLRKILLEQSA